MAQKATAWKAGPLIPDADQAVIQAFVNAVLAVVRPTMALTTAELADAHSESLGA